MNQEDLFTQDPSTELVGVTCGQVQKLVLEYQLDEITSVQAYRRYGKDYQESLDDVGEYRDKRINELKKQLKDLENVN